jgi:hypothetical protein
LSFEIPLSMREGFFVVSRHAEQRSRPSQIVACTINVGRLNKAY